MKAGLIACAALALALPHAAEGWSTGASYPIAVEAGGIERSAHHVYLDMRVWNCSDKPLTMDLANLPWGASLGRGLVIYQAYAGQTLQQAYPIEDFPERRYDIPPHRSIAGQIALDHYFPKLGAMKDIRDFVVFWVYQPLGEKGAPVGRKFGGMVPMGSKRFGKASENPCRLGADR